MRSTSRSRFGKTGQRIVSRLHGQRGLSRLQVGHPLGLRLAEPRDLAVLRLLPAEVGEREAGELLAVDFQRRDATSTGTAVRGCRSGRTRPSRRCHGTAHSSRSKEAHRRRTTTAAIQRSSLVGLRSSSASRRFAYRISPVDDSVTAPSRMFSTNIRYGRSAVARVNTRRHGVAIRDDKCIDLAGGDRPKRVLCLRHSGVPRRASSARGSARPACRQLDELRVEPNPAALCVRSVRCDEGECEARHDGLIPHPEGRGGRSRCCEHLFDLRQIADDPAHR